MRHVSDFRVGLWIKGKTVRTFVTACLIVVFTGALFALQAPAVQSGAGDSRAMGKDMLIRISEIEIRPNYLEEYKTILNEEAEASVSLEAGVIAIFPMYQKDKPTEIRILEIYASREAYESHIKSSHFQKYKTTTLKMVESLKLVDMETLDLQTMTNIFQKMTKR